MGENKYDVITNAKFNINMICKYDDRYGNFLATYGDTRRLRDEKMNFKFSDVIRLVVVSIEDAVGGEAAAMALVNDFVVDNGIDALLAIYAAMIDDFFQMFLRQTGQETGEVEQEKETAKE